MEKIQGLDISKNEMSKRIINIEIEEDLSLLLNMFIKVVGGQ